MTKPADTIYKVDTICPRCLKPLAGEIVAREGRVYLERECPEHGVDVYPIAGDAERFRRNADVYFRRRPAASAGSRKRSLTLHLTDRCDIECPICFTARDEQAADGPTPEAVREILKEHRAPRVALFGGEPLVYKRLDELVSIICRAGSMPVLYTNGVALAKGDRAARLYAAGLREVHLQFDGFRAETCRLLRGEDLVDRKMSAFEKCVEAGFRIVFEVTCTQKTEPAEIRELIDFALENRAVTGLVFRTLGIVGRSGDRSLAMRVDEVQHLVEEATGGRVSTDDMDTFQAIVCAIGDLLRMPRPGCLRASYYPILRSENGAGYETPAEMFPFDRIGPKLQDPRCSNAARLVALAGAAGSLASKSARAITLEMARLVLAQNAGVGAVRSPDKGRLLIIEVAGICDRYNYENVTAHTCPSALHDGSRYYRYLPDGYLDRDRSKTS